MCIGDATFQACAAQKPKRRHHKPHWPLRGALCPGAIVPPRRSRSSRTRRTRDFEDLGESGAADDTVVRSAPQWRFLKRGSDTTMEKPASTWSFDQGTLTVHHLGKTVRSAATPRTNTLRRQLRCTSPSTKRARNPRLCRPQTALRGCSPRNEWPTANSSRQRIPPQVKRYR
jgi:hypothetical protein